jgi:hypothetical protein
LPVFNDLVSDNPAGGSNICSGLQNALLVIMV